MTRTGGSGGKHVSKKERPAAICACGCGETVVQKPGSGRTRKWIPEHKPKKA